MPKTHMSIGAIVRGWILKALTDDGLISVNISITSLSEDTRRILEPRTATIKKRLETVKILSENNIPIIIMIAPLFLPSIAMKFYR
jgi:DNA repair photolyase